jgi:hypothetical protein
MKFKSATAVIALVLAFLVNSYAQTPPQVSAPPVARPSPQAKPQARADGELTNTERVMLQLKLLEGDVKAKIYAMDPDGNPKAEDGATEITDVYLRAARDSELAYKLIAFNLREYYTLQVAAKSAAQASQAVDESSLRLLVLQSTQNQVLIEQNKRIIQLLTEIAKARK